jgi:hypothetical protein
MDISSSTASEAIWGGFLAFGFCSYWGLRLLLRGLQREMTDESGINIGSRGWFIAGGLLMQMPLIGFTVFVWRQGYFSR